MMTYFKTGPVILSPETDDDDHLKPFEVDFEATDNTLVGIVAAQLGGKVVNYYYLLDVVQNSSDLYTPGK